MMKTAARITYSVVAGLVPMMLWAHKSGADPGHTAAPGEDPWACSTSGCHTGLPKGGPLNSYGGKVSATFSTGSFYTPGQPVSITVSVSDPVNSIWHGFQMSARLDSDNSQAGTFRPITGSVVFCADGSVEGTVRTKTGSCPNNQVEYITHTEPSTGTWTYTWIAPANNVGPIHFYLAGNAVNHNDMEDAGDHVYTASYVLQPASTCIQSLPIITTVRSAAGFGGYNFFTSGSYLEIIGSNLAGSTGTWQDSDFNGDKAPTTVQGTSVSINNKPAFVWYISPTQLNVQAPTDTVLGPVGITVTNCSGTSSPATLTRASIAPGLDAPGLDLSPFFNVGGRQYLVATFGPTSLLVGNPNPALPGSFQPAKPNESIWLYGIGFGDAQGGGEPGVKAPGGTTLNAAVTVSFGQTPAAVTYKGLYPGYVGLDLLIITVPNVPDGDYPINVTVNGQPLQQPAAFLTVHK